MSILIVEHISLGNEVEITELVTIQLKEEVKIKAYKGCCKSAYPFKFLLTVNNNLSYIFIHIFDCKLVNPFFIGISRKL
ncbi:Uncharacterised protein [uncultured Clostridium sp.]|nr:Uncharacterised protein [uncultured Clostridium sp.]